MIARIAGTLLASDIDRVEIMTAGGVAYAVHIPLSVAEALPRPGGAVELHTALVVREDSWTLYGFATAAERAMFQRVLGTTGVGPALAMNLMSALGGDRLVRAVQESDLATLTRVPRVGKKLAERLVLELRDKLVAVGDTPMPGRAAALAGPGTDAVRALVALGYLAADAEKAVFATLEEGGAGDTADLIRKALARVAKRG
ncbi:MAG: Holliday junction branch migration protein RuvA [Gemmatimonadaceae bacterium]|nr:Holliday junction branch migration protein RuvA [Gemmatimonadaceae bacterium]